MNSNQILEVLIKCINKLKNDLDITEELVLDENFLIDYNSSLFSSLNIVELITDFLEEFNSDEKTEEFLKKTKLIINSNGWIEDKSKRLLTLREISDIITNNYKT